MSLLAFLSLAATMACLWMGSAAFFQATKTRANNVFTLFCIAAACLCFVDFQTSVSVDAETVRWLAYLYNLWPLAPAALLHFVLVFTGSLQPGRQAWVPWVLYGTAALLSVACLSTAFPLRAPAQAYGGWSRVLVISRTSVLAVFWSSLVCVLSIYLIVKRAVTTVQSVLQKQTRNVAIGVSFFHLSGLVFGGVLPIFRIHVPGLTAISALLGSAFVSYAIRKLGLFAAITEQNRQHQVNIKRVLSAQDQERRRIARELHDETGQNIGSLIAELSILEEEATEERSRGRLKDLRHRTAHTLQEIQRVARGMHPGVLDTLGLQAALEHCVAEFARSTGIGTQIEILGLDCGDRLDQDVEIAVYRVVQEALTNVAKHAEAMTVSVFIIRQPSSIRALIEDDGKGFVPDSSAAAPADRSGLGLLGIRERVGLLGGTLLIEAQPGAGTTLKIDIPLGRTGP
jgi:signal transduction histidine kinase